MGLFKRKPKKAKVVEKTALQNLNQEIRTHEITATNLERLKPRLNKFITHYKKQLSGYNYVHSSGVTMHFAKGIKNYPDGFYAFADKLGLNIEPQCSSRYGYTDEPSFIVSAKNK